MEKNKRSRMPWIVLCGIILVRGLSGGINTISSLFLAPVSKELGIGIGNISIYFSIMSVVQVLWLGTAGKILNKYDARAVAILAICLQALTFAAFGLMKHVTGWYLLSIPQAMGSAILVSLLAPILVNRWFFRNTGTILGIISAFVGLFGAVLQPVTSNLIAKKGWRSAYISMGFVIFTVVLLAIVCLIRNKPKTPVNESIAPENKTEEDNSLQISEETAIRSASFIALLIFMIVLTGVAVFVQHIPTYGIMVGYSMEQMGMVLSLSSIGTAIGALGIGIASDKIGGLRTCYIIIGLWLIAIIGFFVSKTHYLIFAASVFVNGLVSPSVMVLSPILTMIFYGKRDYEKIYAKVAMGAPIASIFLIPIYGFIFDATESYVPVLVILIGLLVLGGVSIALGWKNRCTLEGCPTFLEKKK